MSDRLFTEPLVQSIGWALVHFLWQGTLIAGLAAAILGALRGGRSSARYAIGCAALALMLTAPVATTLRLSSDQLTTVRPATPAQTAPAVSPRQTVGPVSETGPAA